MLINFQRDPMDKEKLDIMNFHCQELGFWELSKWKIECD